MNTLELMKALGGEVLANKARATVDGKVVILGRMIDNKWVITDEGAELAKKVNAATKPAQKAEAPAVKPASKTKARKAS